MIHDLKDSEKTWQIYLLYDLIYEPYKIYVVYFYSDSTKLSILR